MLICPECHFENPDSNNFCQRCGTSLTHTICQKCGADISLNEPECDVCGASNKILLWGIIATKNQESELASVNVAVNQTISQNNNALTLIQNQDLNNLLLQPTQKHLDSQQRYTIEEINSVPLLSINSDWNFIQVQVADKYPLNPSYLRSLKQEKPELFTKLRQQPPNLSVSQAKYCNSFGVPTIALPYLLLQNNYPVIPQLHDAWQEAKQGIVILENRSQWQLLSEIWSQQNLDLIQLLWSLDEIAKLWTPLSKVCCASSLLVESNLRLDEDQSFSLQQLYMDNPNHPPKLSDLATKLQNWLNQYPQNNYEQLNDLLQLAIAGTLESVDQLRHQMHELVKNQPLEATKISNYQEFSDSNSFSSNSDFEDNNYINDNFLYETDNNELPTALIPMELERIDHASCTDIGRQRDHNEDFFGIKTTTTTKDNSDSKTLEVRNLYIVCDGMGGHAAGEVASAMAVETLQNYFQAHWKDEFPDEATIREGILYANQTLCQINSNNYRSGSGRMGTTLVMALIQDTKLAIAHVGDSRIYRMTRKQGLEQLTVDHEVGQREINRGVEPEIAYSRPDAYQLTQALGPRDNKYVKPTINFFDIQEDCLLLLCSDGLSDHELLERHGESYLQPLISSNADLGAGLSELIDFANQHNGHDNITAVLVRVKLQPHL
ncbi:MAG: serine/threonine phosphatase [Xenococcaceae cyanobacterium MO_207.B15]|nr:serine/threonine phosphatase [Xenococcaceae cyanobacterium MO_207.B15]